MHSDEILCAPVALLQANHTPRSPCGDLAAPRSPPPDFAVPPGVSWLLRGAAACAGEEAEELPAAVRAFSGVLAAPGVALKLAVEGCGALAVTASLDPDASVLVLVFNSVRKTVALSSVRQVFVERAAAGGGTVDGHQAAAHGALQVRLELEGDQFCTFLFGSSDEGRREAAYFGLCVRAITEAARFEAVKADLLALGAGTQNDIHRAPFSARSAGSSRARPELDGLSTANPSAAECGREGVPGEAIATRLEAIIAGSASEMPKVLLRATSAGHELLPESTTGPRACDPGSPLPLLPGGAQTPSHPEAASNPEDSEGSIVWE